MNLAGVAPGHATTMSFGVFSVRTMVSKILRYNNFLELEEWEGFNRLAWIGW